MAITLAEADESFKEFFPYAGKHTDVILLFDSNGKSKGIASSVHVKHRGVSYLLTADHSLAGVASVFSSPKRLDRKMVEGNSIPTPAMPVLLRDQELDIAVLDSSQLPIEQADKERLDITHAGLASQEVLSANLGTLSYIHGVFGRSVEGCQYDDGLVYMEIPLYVGLGPMTTVLEHTIIADFAEKELLAKNTAAFPKLSGLSLTHGPRDIHGCSGSGLWMKSTRAIELVGIMRGRDPNNRADQHLIRFCPIWKIRSLIESLAP